MPKDTVTRTTKPAKAMDPFYAEVHRFAAAVAAHPGLNSTAKLVAVWLLFKYANTDHFNAVGILKVWPSIPTITDDLGLTRDQVDLALASLTRQGFLILTKRGRGKGNGSVREFNRAVLASNPHDVSPSQFGDNAGGGEQLSPTSGAISPSQFGDNPTLSPSQFGTTYRLKTTYRTPTDQAREDARPGGGVENFEEQKVEQATSARPSPPPKVPRQSPKAKTHGDDAADATAIAFQRLLSPPLFDVGPQYDHAKLTAYHVRKLRDAGVADADIIAIAEEFADAAKHRRACGEPPPRLPTDMRLLKRAEEIMTKREQAKARTRTLAQEAAQREEQQRQYERAENEYSNALLGCILAYRRAAGEAVSPEREVAYLGRQFNRIYRRQSDEIGISLPLHFELADIVEAGRRFASDYPEEFPQIEEIAAVLATVVSERQTQPGAERRMA